MVKVTQTQITGFPITRQNIASNSSLVNPRIETGWNFVTGTGTTFADKAVTYGAAFTTTPIIILSNIGYKDSSDPTNPADVTGAWELPQPTSHTISGSGLTVRMGISNGTTYASTRRVLFSWIAIGV